MGDEKRDLVKVRFELQPGAWHGSATETMWAEAVGPGQYRLANSPFYAFGVSFEDTVLARREGTKLVFVETIRRGGHSTYRIIPTTERQADVDRYWEVLETRFACAATRGAWAAPCLFSMLKK
jgi:hypothetical protein